MRIKVREKFLRKLKTRSCSDFRTQKLIDKNAVNWQIDIIITTLTLHSVKNFRNEILFLTA